MKKLMSLLFCALCVGSLMGEMYFPFEITIPAGSTSGVSTNLLYKTGMGVSCGVVDSITVGSTAGTATSAVSVARFDFGVNTGATIASFACASNTVYYDWPKHEYLEMEGVTNREPYLVKQVIIRANITASGVDSVWKGGIFTK